MKRKIIAFISLMVAMPLSMQAIVIGSDTVISRQALATFPSTDTDNEMRGFAMFEGGFILQDNTTTCTFNDFFPVSGTIDLNGGTLTLAQDLVLYNILNFQGMGNIIGDGHSMDVCATVTWLPLEDGSFQDTTLTLNNSLTLNSTVTFSGDCIIDGRGNSLILSSSAALVVGSGATLELRNVELIGTQTNNVRCVDNTAQLILNDMKWRQSAHAFFTTGSILFNGQVDFLGSYTFNYSSSQTSTVLQSSRWRIADGLRLSIGRDSVTLNEPLAFIDSSSTLRLDNCSFAITSSGMQVTKGTLVFERNVDMDILSTNSSNGFHVGNGSAPSDMVLYFAPASLLRINRGHFYYNNVSAASLQSPSITAQLRRGTLSAMFIAQNLVLPSLTVVPETNFVPPIIVNSGVQLSYNGSKIILPFVEFNIVSSQQSLTTLLLNGSTNYLDIVRGILPLGLLISGTSSSIRGSGTLLGPVVFSDSAATSNIDLAGFVSGSITLTGGRLSLQKDLSFNSSASLVGPGTINLSSNTLRLHPTEVTFATPTKWEGVTGTLDIRAKLSLASTWTVSGTVVINGNGNTLDLSAGGNIVVDTNSEVQFKNIRLQGIQGTNIRCVDNTARLLLLNTQWEQSGDYSFSAGSMKFVRDNYLSGAYTFTYDSARTSTINSNSSVTVSNDLQFYIGRTSGVEPVYFTDMTSVLELDNSRFIINPTGMSLTRGKMFASRDVEVSVLSTSTANGLQFGDGTVSGDMKLFLNPGCSARYTGGHATMDITTNDPIKSNSNTARIVRSDTSVFYLKNDVTLADVTVDVSPLASFLIDPGKTLDYSNSRIVLEQGTFDVTGDRYDNFTTLLNGDGSINILDGELPLVTLVQSTGNVLGGNGHVTGPIMLMDSGAQLICGLSGFIYAPITLNLGTVTLTNDLNLANGIILTTSGTVELNDNNVKIGKTRTTWSGDIDWDGSSGGGSVSLSAQVDLTGTWTFNGTCDLKGNGNTLSLGATGALVVGPNSILTLYDISLEGIADLNIRCVDDTGVIILDDVYWKQGSNNYSFNYGALQFKNQVLMRGTGIFAYATAMTSTLNEQAQLIFDRGFTFSYGPNSVSQNLLQFTDDTSQLYLNSATMYITGTGMVLTKGMLMVQNHTRLLVEDTPDGNGITFGDGTDDLFVEIGAGAQLNVTQGVLSYKNINLDSWNMVNYISALHMSDNTTLQLYESLDNNPGVVQFDDNTTLTRIDGKIIVGSMYLNGRIQYNNIF